MNQVLNMNQSNNTLQQSLRLYAVIIVKLSICTIILINHKFFIFLEFLKYQRAHTLSNAIITYLLTSPHPRRDRNPTRPNSSSPLHRPPSLLRSSRSILVQQQQVSLHSS